MNRTKQGLISGPGELQSCHANIIRMSYFMNEVECFWMFWSQRPTAVSGLTLQTLGWHYSLHLLCAKGTYLSARTPALTTLKHKHRRCNSDISKSGFKVSSVGHTAKWLYKISSKNCCDFHSVVKTALFQHFIEHGKANPFLETVLMRIAAMTVTLNLDRIFCAGQLWQA